MVTKLKSESEFNEAIKASSFSVVHFQAEWAEQCSQVHELLEALSCQPSYSNFKFYSCPAEDLSEVSLKYNIEAVPTVILFQNGKNVEVIHGADVKKITEVINKYDASKYVSSSGDSQKVPLEERLKVLINKGKVMLFMKGDRTNPRCGFSRKIIDILNETSVPYETFDILTDEEVRQGLKTYSNWPTYPQLYVNGDLLGGLDIIKEMLEAGDLLDLLKS